MILADTSVWIEHLRRGSAALADALEQGDVITHPVVIGELACGNIRNRREILQLLANLPVAVIAADTEVLLFIEHHRLYGKGIGYADVQLLASASLTHGARLWTLDTRLAAAAHTFGLAFR